MITNEILINIIESGDYLPANKHLTKEEFSAKYGLEKLIGLKKDKEMLKFLFGTKEQNPDSLTYSLECNKKIIDYYVAAKPGYATTKVLNYSKGTWKNKTQVINEEKAIEIANKIRLGLIAVLQQINSESTAEDIKRYLDDQSVPTNQNWLGKYFTILFPDKFMPMQNMTGPAEFFYRLA